MSIKFICKNNIKGQINTFQEIKHFGKKVEFFTGNGLLRKSNKFKLLKEWSLNWQENLFTASYKERGEEI